MEIEFWWIIPIALFFALGWIAARIDIRQVVRESRTLPRSYLKGLNFLLNEQPDKAIDSFLEAVKVEPQTVELHFALGSLFRRRGETERAIRMHQNLVERDDLNQEQREQALVELGQDYLKAGLLDRAESIFLKLRGSHYNEAAIRCLLDIYQQEKDWRKAIDIAQALTDHESIYWRKEVANFYCEEATTALANSEPDAANEFLDKALIINPRCVRANIVRGDLFASQNNLVNAIKVWKRVENQDPGYLSLVAERVMEANEKLGLREQGLTLLRSWLERHSSLDLLEHLYKAELEENGANAAYVLVKEELSRNPTLLGLEKLLEVATVMVAPVQRGDLDLIKQLIHNHTRRVARYCCNTCGFKARQFQWRCPACGGWETYPPKRTEEYDLAP